MSRLSQLPDTSLYGPLQTINDPLKAEIAEVVVSEHGMLADMPKGAESLSMYRRSFSDEVPGAPWWTSTGQAPRDRPRVHRPRRARDHGLRPGPQRVPPEGRDPAARHVLRVFRGGLGRP